jgi:molecular chaperone DnaK (HSP70)
MVRDVESHAAEDRKRREQIDTKNLADSAAYQAEKQLRDLGDRVSAADKSRVEGLVKDLREAINQENYDQMKSVPYLLTFANKYFLLHRGHVGVIHVTAHSKKQGLLRTG